MLWKITQNSLTTIVIIYTGLHWGIASAPGVYLFLNIFQNTINHSNSMFVPRHDRRSFVEGEVDMVSGVGYNPSRRLKGMREDFINLKK